MDRGKKAVGQGKHETAPTSLAYDPMGQSKHDDRPDTLVNIPGEHEIHDAAVMLENVPVSQADMTPSTQALPAMHGAIPVRWIGSVSIGMVYQPTGATIGVLDPSGQYTSTPPHGCINGLVEASGHT